MLRPGQPGAGGRARRRSCAGSASEEESFGRTLDRGTELLDRLIADALASSTSWIDADDAFQLHDTYGFPYDLTRELRRRARASASTTTASRS